MMTLTPRKCMGGRRLASESTIWMRTAYMAHGTDESAPGIHAVCALEARVGISERVNGRRSEGFALHSGQAESTTSAGLFIRLIARARF